MRKRLADLALLGFGLLLIGVAGVLLIGRSEVLGALGALLFGVATAAVGAAQLIAPPRQLRLSLTRVSLAQRSIEGTAFETWRVRGLLFTLGAAGMAGMGALLPLALEGLFVLVVGVTGVVFFGSIAVLGGAQAAARRAGVLLPQGLLWSGSLGTTWLPWSAIRDVLPHDFGDQPFLGVELADNAGAKIAFLHRVMSRLNRKLTGFDLSFALQIVKGPPEQVADFIRYYLQHPERREELGRAASLSRGMQMPPSSP